MFPLYTILEYNVPSHLRNSNLFNQYRSLVTKDGVFGVDNHQPRRMIYHSPYDVSFSSVDEWIASLPGKPDITQITTVTQYADLYKNAEKQQPASHWKKPILRNHPRLKWPVFIYKKIVECDKELLNRDDMRNAYNHLVDVITSFQNLILTYEPLKRQQYSQGIDIDSSIKDNHSELQRMIGTITGCNLEYSHFIAILHIIYTAYLPLLELFKSNVIPFMEKKENELRIKTDIREMKRLRDYYVQKMMRLTETYEREAEHYRQYMDRFQTALDEAEQKMSQL